MKKLTLLLAICASPILAFEQASKQDGAVYLLAKSKHTDLKIETMQYYFISQINRAKNLVKLERICSKFMPLYLDCISMDKQKSLEKIHTAFARRETEIMTDIMLQLIISGITTDFNLSKGLNSIEGYNFLLRSLRSCTEKYCAGVAKLLIENGVALNRRENSEATPLHIAIDKKAWLAKLLIRYKANVHARDENGQTPMHLAAYNGNTDIIALLLERGADINTLDSNFGRTPLHSAMNADKADAVILLLNAGADINAQDLEMRTPLHVAASLTAREHIKILLKNGADKTLKNKYGFTAQQIAYNHYTAKLLEEYNCVE